MKIINKRRPTALMAIALAIVGSSLLILTNSAHAITSSIWTSTTVPPTPTSSDSQSVELGVKFRSNTAGAVTGIRFYKGAGNTGTHSGSLWSLSGTKLATVTFSGETASGWQQASFATPVNITANTIYVASYHAPKGHYASDEQYFANAATTNGPLTALKDGASGGNGVYRYGAAVAFPNSTYQSTNYWVDPVFSYTSTADTTPPTVSSVTPANSTTSTPASSNVTAVFSEALDPATVNGSFELRDSSNALVAAALSYDSASKTVTLDPTADLNNGATYTASIKTTFKDLAGNALAAQYNWSFTVIAASSGTDLSQGTGGPVLVLNSSTNPFSKYYAEILRAEGFNSFASGDIANVSASQLNQYSVVILGDVPVTDTQVSLLTSWVTAGGNLIAMHPDKKLAGLLGVTDQASTISDAYMLIDTSTSPGSGITGQTMQYHGSADKYTAQSGTQTVATLYSTDTAATTNPAITMRSVGTNGGQAGAFTYDLAKSVIYTHQGNPAWAGQERDGSAPIRPDDLFYGAKAGDVQPDYVNLNKVAIPQADEQQRLLGNMIEFMNKDRNPLPKFWYFPNDKKAVIVMAGDDHATANGTQSSFDNMIASSPAGCVVANWECVRGTSWMYTSGPLTDTQASAYYNQGFDLGVHVSTGCNDWTPASLDQTFASDLSGFKAKYPSLPNQTGSRTHCIAWSDYASTPVIEQKYGIRMDFNYYYWPGSWVQNRPGYFTGSGLNMRFANTDGSMIDVYQSPSHLVNESGQTFPDAINLQLDRALGPEGYYGALGTHYDYTDSFDRQLIASAQARNVPIVSVQQMLDWTDGRNASSYTAPSWNNNVLNFTATVNAKAGAMMRGMLPVVSSKGTLTGLTKAGATVNYTVETIKGISYAIYPVTTGSYAATYSADTTAPTVTAQSPVANATDVDTTANVTATFSEPLDPSTVTTASLELRDAANAIIPSTVSYDSATNKITMHPTSALTGNATYTATIHGGAAGPRVADLSGNALAADQTWSFTTGIVKLSLWYPTVPNVSNATSDTARVELGTQFTSDIAGNISAITFYKSANDAAQHTVTLWNSAGTALGTATTSNETASGWQVATFATPIAITASTTYTASYTALTGQYSYTSGNLSSGFSNNSLHVPANGGVYNYGSGVPTSSFNGSNYWIDVVFNP